jgi:phosphoglycolate phosphatase
MPGPNADGIGRLIIFDIDGTLVDSRKLIVETQNRVFISHGLKPPVEGRGLSVIGLSLHLALTELAGKDAPIDAMVSTYHRLLPALRADDRYAETPFVGSEELLAELSRTPNVILGIATGHEMKGLEPLIDKFGWQLFFRTVQTADRAFSKPHPSMILQALNETGIKPNDAMMIGDTMYDMQMAVAAGVRAIGVAWGYHHADRLRASGATYIAEDIPSLREYLIPT